MTDKIQLQITAETKDAEQSIARLLSSVDSLRSVNFNNVGNVGASASSGLSGVVKLTAAIGALVAAGMAAKAAFSSGITANIETENVRNGLEATIASLYSIKDASGQTLTGMKALDAAGAITEKQLQALRVAGMNTSAEFIDLANAFRTAISTGASAGLSIDQTRELTVKLVQAAGVFNVQKEQLSSEIRSVLSGEEIDNSEIAKALGLTGAQIKLWREQGKLAENLNDRLKEISLAGEKANTSWSSTFSNLNDGYTLFMREASAGAFDEIKQSLNNALKAGIDSTTGAIKPEFKGLADFANEVFSAIGDGLAGAIDGAVESTKELSAWLAENKETVDNTVDAFLNVVSAVQNAVGTVSDLITSITGATTETGILETLFNGVALGVALTTDGFKMLGGAVAALGATIVAAVLVPMKAVAQVIDAVAGTKLASMAANAEKTAIATANAAAGVMASGIKLESVKRLEQSIVDRRIKSMQITPGTKTGTASGATLGVPKYKPAKKDDGKAAKQAEQEAKKEAAALDNLNKALAERSAKQAKSLREQALAQLNADLEAQFLSQSAYLERKAAIEQKALDDEKASKQARLAELQSSLSAEKKTKAERLQVQAEIEKIKGDIDELDGRKAIVSIELSKDSAAVKRYLDELRSSLQADLLDATGSSFAAERSRLKAETEKQLADPRVKDDEGIQSLIKKLAQAKAQIIDFNESARKTAEIKDVYDRASESIQRAKETGVISEAEAERQLQAEKEKTLAAMKAQLDATRAIADASGNVELQKQVAQLTSEYENLAAKIDETAKRLNDTFYGSLESSLEDALTGAKSWGDAFKSVIADVIKELAKIQFAKFAANSLGGETGGLGGLLSNAMNFVGRAVGGSVSAGGAYIVGERGPEPFFPGVSGTIVPTARLQQVLADMLGMRARTAPSSASAAAGLPQFKPGDTNVSVSPRVVLSTKQLTDALRETPEFEHAITALAQRNFGRISKK